MITYHPKKLWGWVVLSKCGQENGSVIPRCLPYGIVSAMLALLVKLDNAGDWGVFTNLGMEEKQDSVFDHPYALQIWGVAVGFLLVFRGNLGYARYWEARAKLATMSSFLQEVAMCAVCYDEASKDINQYREWKQVRFHSMSRGETLQLTRSASLCRRKYFISARCYTPWSCSACVWIRTWTISYRSTGWMGSPSIRALTLRRGPFRDAEASALVIWRQARKLRLRLQQR